MMADDQPLPLILCMENISGEEVTLKIEPTDDFQTFLHKTKTLLGFDVDINSVTRNQPVSLTENIYQFLLNADHGLCNDTDLAPKSLNHILEPTGATDDLVYILDDGTQINASQIHFDNEDDIVDLTAEEIPFVKYTDDDYDDISVNAHVEDTKKFNITDSPVSRWSSENSSPRCSFVNSLPFKLVCNNTAGFEAQFTKYLEGSSAPKTYTMLNPVTAKNKSPRSLIRENYKTFDSYHNNSGSDNLTAFSREDILNMFKDSPVATIPHDNICGKRKHVRKSDPTRPMAKKYDSLKPYSYLDVDCKLMSHTGSQSCFICAKLVENNADKLYFFDNEDQKVQREVSLRKQVTHLKIICEECLSLYFAPCKSKSPTQSLSSNEYLVIRNSQQYLFQKISNFTVKNEQSSNSFAKREAQILMGGQEKEFIKLEVSSDGQIINKSGDNVSNTDNSILKEEKAGSSSDVEIIEPVSDDHFIDNLEEAEEHVKEFLGKYQAIETNELKCRFCLKQFSCLQEVVEHGTEHRHDLEDGEVFPCPLCDYGYNDFKWLKGHLKAAHEKIESNNNDEPGQVKAENGDTATTKQHPPSATSPGTKGTGNSSMQMEPDGKDNGNSKTNEELQTDPPKSELTVGENISNSGPLLLKTEVKQETVDTSDEEAIWIVQTAEDDSDLNEEQVRDLLRKAKANDNAPVSRSRKNQCLNCSQLFISQEMLALHKCTTSRHGRKRQTTRCMTSEDDVLKKTRKKKCSNPSSDPQIVTCHNCNVTFTSKVRLKFHMQFHEATAPTSPGGRYNCAECGGARFPTESALFDHVHFQHHKQRRWQCLVPACGKTFYLRANLTKHSRVHTDTRRYVCPSCGKRFLDKQTLDEHSVTHLQIKPYQCHICMKQLTRRSRLRMHLRAHEEELTPRSVLACAVCLRAFKNAEEAEEHVRASTSCTELYTSDVKVDPELRLSPTSGLVSQPGDPVREAEGSLATRLIKREIADAEPTGSVRAQIRHVRIEKAFRCEFCEDVFYIEEGLNQHRQIHKGVKNPFTCHICKVSFATYSRCTTHKTTHGYYKRSLEETKPAQAGHPAAGPCATGILGYGDFPVAKHFLCEDCGRSYLHWTYLQVHRRMKHAGEGFVYHCDLCDITFPNSWSIAYHKKKVHNNTQSEGPAKLTRDNYRIPCRDCDEVLPNKTSLYKHRKNKHSDPSQQGPFWCSGCGEHEGLPCRQGFAHCSSVPDESGAAPGGKWPRSPRRTHACAHCPRTFRTAGTRDEHARTHTGERPFPCDLCGLAFRRSSAMRNHRLIHTGVRAWACPRCPKRFRIRSDLRTHIRLKHPEKILVVEIEGLSPTPDQVLEVLTVNNIATEKVLDISTISFAKGTRSLVPSSERALALLSQSQEPQPTWGQSTCEEARARRGRGLARHLRRPAILQHGAAPALPQMADLSALLPAEEVASRPLGDLTQ